MGFLHLADTLELAHRGVIYKQFRADPCTGQFRSRQLVQIGLSSTYCTTKGCRMCPHYLELAGQLLDKPLALAHSLNCRPLLVHLGGPTAACNKSPAGPQAG